MVNKFSDEEYAKILPKKQVGTAVLFFNSKGELLVLHPTYREGWLVPGGATDINESPLSCAIRETREEIGLTTANLQLVGIYYAPQKGFFTDSLKFIYSGGILNDNEIAQIKLQVDEVDKYKFVSSQEAVTLLSHSLKKSLLPCLEAIENKSVVYLENF